MNPIDGAYQITNKVQVVDVNWVLLKSYYRLPTLLFLSPLPSPLSPPRPFLPPTPSLFILSPSLASEEWGTGEFGGWGVWQADSDLGKMTSN